MVWEVGAAGAKALRWDGGCGAGPHGASQPSGRLCEGSEPCFTSPVAALGWGTETPTKNFHFTAWTFKCLRSIPQVKQPDMELT